MQAMNGQHEAQEGQEHHIRRFNAREGAPKAFQAPKQPFDFVAMFILYISLSYPQGAGHRAFESTARMSTRCRANWRVPFSTWVEPVSRWTGCVVGPKLCSASSALSGTPTGPTMHTCVDRMPVTNALGRPRHFQSCSATYSITLTTCRSIMLMLPRYLNKQSSTRAN